MPTFSSYDPSLSAESVALWNDCLGDDFPMDLRLWQQNIDNNDFLWSEASHVAKDDSGRLIGVLIAKRPWNINCVFVHPSHQRQGIGRKLFERTVQVPGTKPIQTWIVGQDRGHFFPGVPTQFAAAQSFFKSLGFSDDPGLITDLDRKLVDYEIEPRVKEKIAELAADGITIGPCAESEIPWLLHHIEINFSPRWLADTQKRLDAEGQPSEIIVARKDCGAVIGFAHTYTNKSRFIGPSIYWRKLLGPDYGGLGPIGVDKDHRKIGLGLALLAASIQSVKDRGATHMAIDWTVLVDFYAKVGFSSWKTYVGMKTRQAE